jgi:hypothetical protein
MAFSEVNPLRYRINPPANKIPQKGVLKMAPQCLVLIGVPGVFPGTVTNPNPVII